MTELKVYKMGERYAVIYKWVQTLISPGLYIKESQEMTSGINYTDRTKMLEDIDFFLECGRPKTWEA